MRTSETYTRWRARLAVVLAVSSTLTSTILVPGGAGGCGGDAPTLPTELKALGSLRSAEYASQYLYPARGVSLQVMRPRLGDPALLSDEDLTFELVFYVSDPVDASRLSFSLRDDRGGGDGGDGGGGAGERYALRLLAPPVCDAAGLCRTLSRAPPETPTGRLLTLCLDLGDVGDVGDDTDCRPGAVYRYAAVPDPLRVAVVADPQLGGIEGEPRLTRRLERVYAAIMAREPPPHLAVVVGDLTQHGTASEQERFMAASRAFGRPLLLIPGNHDFKDGNIDEYLLRVLPHLDHANRLGPYVFVGLNSGPQSRTEGRRLTAGVSYGLERAQVDWLGGQIAPDGTGSGGEGEGEGGEEPARVELVYVHHSPYAVFLSVIGRNRERLLRVCEAGGVGLILAGHTHMNEVYDKAGIAQGLDPRCGSLPASRRQPVSLVTARSTDRSAGYRWLTIHSSGEIDYCWFDVAVD